MHRRAPHVGNAGYAGAIEHVPGGGRAHDRGAHRVLGIAAGERAFDRAAQDRIVTVGDGGDANCGLGRTVAREIAGELGVRAFHHVSGGIEPEVALDHDLGRGRHVQVDALAFDEFDRCAADCAHHVVLAHALRHRRSREKVQRRLPADRHRDRHLGAAALLPGGDVVADMLRAPHQDGNAIVAGEHAAVDADVHGSRFRVPGDAAAVGEEVAAPVEPVPMRRGKLVEIDVGAGEDVLLRRPGGDDLGRDRAAQDGAGDLDQLARVAVGRQPQHHGDAAVIIERGAEDAPAAARRRVVVLDVVEDERLAGAGPLREPHDGAELDVPVDLGSDFRELALLFDRGDPAAQITEGDRLSFDRNILGPGLKHAALYTTRARLFSAFRLRGAKGFALARGELHRVDNLRIGAAAAEIA